MSFTEEEFASLRLAKSENVGRSTFFRLLEIFGSAKLALESLPEIISKKNVSRKIKICSHREAEAELKNVHKFGAEILLFSDKRYPRLLREIPDPSPIITVKGDVEFLTQDSIAIVGPRNASFNAVAFAKKIALELGENSIITVSGMARGVDAAVHEASILSGTIGVIAGGINSIYPQENRRLYEEVSSRGLLITEIPFGVSPKGGNFVQRNRLISGISLAVVVLEAGIRSGSLITARFALDQGREVFAVPGSPFDSRCRGTNRLIRDGANMFEKINDILDEIPRLKILFKNVGMLSEPKVEQEFTMPKVKMPSDADIKKTKEEILARLSFSSISVEEIVKQLEVSTRVVNIALVQLELDNEIEINFQKVALKPN